MGMLITELLGILHNKHEGAQIDRTRQEIEKRARRLSKERDAQQARQDDLLILNWEEISNEV